MGGMRFWAAGVLALILAALAPASGLAAPAPAPFEAEIAAAKGAMMADPSAALTRARTAERLAGPSHDPTTELARATALWLEAEALVRLDRAPEGLSLAGSARRIAERMAPDSKLVGDLLITEGYADQTTGKPAEALRDYQRASAILHKVGDLRGQSKTLQMIGGIYDDAKDYARALDYYRQASDIYRLDDALSLSAFNNAGVTLKNLGRYAEAEQSFRRALHTADQLDSNSLRLRILTNIADDLARSGHLDAARAEIARARAIAARDPSVADWVPFLWGVQAEVDLAAGRVDLAAQHIGRAFAGADLATTPEPFREFHQLAYRIYKRQGDYGRSLAHLEAFKRLEDASWQLAGSTSGQLAAAQFDFTNQTLQIARLKLSKLSEQQRFSAERDGLTALLLAVFTVALALAVTAFLIARRGHHFAQDANRRLEEANQSLERAVAARTEFLARTSHEIRTPLNGIIGVAHALLSRSDLTPEVRSMLSMLRHCGDAMASLVSDILDMAAIERKAVSLAEADHELGTLLHDAVEVWRWRARDKGLSFEVEAPGELPRIVCDGVKFRQVLDNLLSNALKFTAEGGIGVACVVAGEGEAVRVAITVRDTGIGIGAGQRERIFEPFHQVDGGTSRRYEGTGLGLSISRELARLMGGDLVLEAQADGSAFTFHFIAQGLARPTAAAGDPASPPIGGDTLLLVDPNPLNATFLRMGLKASGRSIRTVSDLQDEAVSAGQDAPAIVLLSIDGPDTAGPAVRLARTRFPAARLLVLCAPDHRPDARSVDHGLAEAWLDKPLPLPALMAALDRPAPAAPIAGTTAA